MSEWILQAIAAHDPNLNLKTGSNEVVTIKQLAEYIAMETAAEIEYSTAPFGGGIYISDRSETRIKLGVEQGQELERCSS
jgi:hypothetical protein